MVAKNRNYLEWAKSKGGECCICRWIQANPGVPGVDLHHIGESGTGMKGSDCAVARVCRRHHRLVQGKRWKQFERDGELAIWAALVQDALALLVEWSEIDRQETQQQEEMF